MKHIMKCPVCGKYTMKENCCEITNPAKPLKYSPEDKYGEYRRKLKEEEIKKKGLL
jgi:H/ACA ribonucleoprotein complex subunit 3